jgi:SSS family solute:Na+ symporter
MDFVRTFRLRTSDQGLARWGRWSTVGFMLAAILWSPIVLQFPTLWQYLQSFMSYITPPVTAVFIIGIFWPRANAAGALATLLIGVPLGILGWAANELLDWLPLQYLYAAGIMFALSALILVAVSLATAPPHPDKVQQCTWRPALWRQETRDLADTPWYANYRYMALGLTLLAAAMVVWWW